eukprot:symbB.v1.2.034242.t1/scaffold4248.1/size42442/1
MTVTDSVSPDGPYLASPQEAVSPGPIDDLWDKALDNYGLVRPTEVTEIHVFRVILQSTWNKNACTRTVTRTDPRDDPFQTLTRIIGEWPDLELEEQHQSWRLFPVHRACTWSSANELSSSAYVLTRKGNPFHLLRSHAVLEVVWGHRLWTTAIAFPKWINKYHCIGLFARVGEPMITPIALQAALQRSIHTLYLPGAPLQDELVQMKVFIPQGVSCFSGAAFDCTSTFENWQQVLKEEGQRVCSGRNPDTMIFHRVNIAIEEVCPCFEPAVKHFILADTAEQEQTRTVVFAVFTSRFEFFGACHWTPTTREEGALIPGPGLLRETPVQDSALLHHWYEVTGEIGRPHYGLIFEHVLRQCGYLSGFHTVYVMVDNRDLANHQRQDPSLPHWPAAARWWHSRLKLMGPHKEKMELLLFPISESTGLHHVHPTWAGTFVLAALVAVFPGINFVLLDSDCLPVTLFEVEDLWTEAYLARFPAHGEGGILQAHPLRALARYSNDPKVVYTQSRVSSTRMGQAALVVSEPHAELNAGLIVIFRSSHPSLFDWNAWSLRLRSSPESITEDVYKEEASNLAFAFWDRMGEFLKRSRTSEWHVSGLLPSMGFDRHICTPVNLKISEQSQHPVRHSPAPVQVHYNQDQRPFLFSCCTCSAAKGVRLKRESLRFWADAPSLVLFDKDTQLLLTPKFWLLPLYRELLNSARRIRPSPASERARGCTGLVKVICKENKEQKGKRKYHAGTPHPNDRGGFPQWFGSCSLMTTLHVWFPACWAPMVAERLFPWSPPPTHMRVGLTPHTTPQASSWHQPCQGATSSNEPMGDNDSTEVKYKIRQWSLPGATVVPVLNVTSRVFWLELDDKALLDSYGVLQEGILCDVFSQKCSAAWQGARGERLTVSVMLPGRLIPEELVA